VVRTFDHSIGGTGTCKLTGEIAKGSDPEAPAGMLSQSVNHVVEKAYAGPDPDLLRGRVLAGMMSDCLFGQ
jgi:hypothetical protein